MLVEVRAKKIKLLVLDCDGVLTDGGLYYDHLGNISKRFNVQDGLGIKTAQAAGIEVAVVSGLNHGSVEARVTELGIAEYHAGHVHKPDVVRGICDRLDATLEETAYLGDDWVDLAPMQIVGLPMAVANAQPEVLGIAKWISRQPGGHGAVREAIRFLLLCQGKLEAACARWTD